jgi:DNA (cytosine-5)-methyltransferase 1
MRVKKPISVKEYGDKPIQISVVEEGEDQAVLTHYLHNYRSSAKSHYEVDALATIHQIVEYKQAEGIYAVEDELIEQLLFEIESIPFPSPEDYTFEFIDLFAGIGGFRLALQNLGGKCVFTSEWNTDAKKTYKANFGELPFGDITKERIKNYIPDKFDILCAGFPCQAFSIAGYQKGFADTRGTLFWLFAIYCGFK